MLEALRGLGYTTATALADIIDNSIAAQAGEIAVDFRWDGQRSVITILDDGQGMTEAELDAAMRLGHRSPLDAREPNDLGRFGLGLKTASFSQCRRLTVASRKADCTFCLRWDLDILETTDEDGWFLLEGPANGSDALLEPLKDKVHGTIVLWEHLDRIVTGGFTEQDYLDLIDQVEQHLAMVFHRFLEGARPRLRILVNGRLVAPWDPFLASHPATWSSPIERFETDGGTVEVQCHVLPHRDRLDPREYERASGPAGWPAQQGFYVYRNQRLLVHGSWLGLGYGRGWTKEEAHRLARIRLDIPNSADADWKLDIRKSTAKPPVCLRGRLTRLAEDTRSRARRVFAHRGQVIAVPGQTAISQAWRAEHTSAGMRYRIDLTHPVVKALLDDAGPLRTHIQAMLRVIEETVPVQRIWLDTTEGKDVPRTGFSGEAPAEILSVMEVMFRNMVEKKGMSPRMAKEQLARTEPFHNYPDLVMTLQEQNS
ncbi:ATPase [Geomonas sp. Red276]